jgi:hypothetical protein
LLVLPLLVVVLVVRVYLVLAQTVHLEALAVGLEDTTLAYTLLVVLELPCKGLREVAQLITVVVVEEVVVQRQLVEPQALAVIQLQVTVVLDWLHPSLELA